MFSKTCKYAIRAMLYLAKNSDENNKFGVEDIATGLDIPKHFLAKVLQQLTRKNIATSAKGRNGGFYLTEKNKAITILKIVETIDGADVFTSCILGLPECGSVNPCSFHKQSVEYRDSMQRELSKETIRETAKRINLNNFKL